MLLVLLFRNGWLCGCYFEIGNRGGIDYVCKEMLSVPEAQN